jgi:hypothetical protein
MVSVLEYKLITMMTTYSTLSLFLSYPNPNVGILGSEQQEKVDLSESKPFWDRRWVLSHQVLRLRSIFSIFISIFELWRADGNDLLV